MTVHEHGYLVADLVAAEAALRCRCDRPCLFVVEDGVRCLKCGRAPALGLAAATQPDCAVTLEDDGGD